MGTLYDQSIRPKWVVNILGESRHHPKRTQHDCDMYRDTIEDFAHEFIALSEATRIPISDLVALFHTLELRRRNNMIEDNADRYDEQLAGLGTELSNIAEAITALATAVESKE